MTTNDNALATVSTVDSLICGLRSHVLGRSLPAPAYVRLDALSRTVSVYPHSGHDLVSKLANVLLWAHSLTDVTAEWWHTEDRLHITVSGRTSSGLRMEVYQGGGFDEATGLVRLDQDQTEGVSLDELYALMVLLRAQHDHEGAA